MRLPVAGALAGAAALGAAWAVRGRASQVFGPSVWRGSTGRQAIALTFDDGPSPGTAAILEILHRHHAPATFFQCGLNVERHPALTREAAAAGHEIGNHSHTHPNVALAAPRTIYDEFARAQHVLTEAAGAPPVLFRAPYGVRWFGFSEMQRRLNLTGVMWTVIASDWRLPAPRIAERVLRNIRDGAIICLHDGRATEARPDISQTTAALRQIIPALLDQGFHFETVSRILL